MDRAEELQQKLIEFAEERDWEKFQSPKNLAMAISIEAAELMEHYQWLTLDESHKLSEEKRQEAAYELADVFMYTLLMAKRMNIDLVDTATAKLAINEVKYPKERVRGKALKYTEYPAEGMPDE